MPHYCPTVYHKTPPLRIPIVAIADPCYNAPGSRAIPGRFWFVKTIPSQVESSAGGLAADFFQLMVENERVQ